MKKYFKNILKFAVSFLLIYLFLSKIQLASVFSDLKTIPPGTIILVLILNLIAILISIWKWHILLPRISFREISLANLAGRFYSFILPGQILGEAAKIYHITSGQAIKEKIVASVIVDKLNGVLAILVLGLVGLLFTVKNFGWFFFLLGLLLLFIVFLFSLRIKIVYDFLFRLFVKFKKLGEVLLSWREYSNRVDLMLFNFILGLAFQFIGVYAIFLAAQELNLQVSFLALCWVFAAVSAAMLIPVTIAGLGVREGSFIALLGLVGVSQEKALALALVLFAIQIFDAGLGALAFLYKLCQKPRVVQLEK